MKLKKSLRILLIGFSLVMSMMLVSCPELNNVTDDELGVITDQKTGVKFKNTLEGIEISWSNLPAEANNITIRCYSSGSKLGTYTLFEIWDLSTVTSVKDKYVAVGNEYEYYIEVRAKNGSWITSSDGWIKIKPLGGKGELDSTVAANNDGIRLTKTATAKNSKFSFARTGYPNSSDYSINKNGNLDFTDKYVEGNKEYTYRICEQIGSTGYWSNGKRVECDAVVEYPRYKEKTVTAKGGSGNIYFTQIPEVTHLVDKNRVELTTDPVFSVTPNSWNFTAYYEKENWGITNVYETLSSNKKSGSIFSSDPEGEYKLRDCRITLSFDDYTVSYSESNSSNPEALKKLPQTIIISNENNFRLVATPTDEGIKLEWKNLPEGTTMLRIRDDDWEDLFKIYDLTNITSVIDKNVTKGKNYTYSLEARKITDHGDSSLDSSSRINVTATGGSGENKFNLQATADGIKVTGTKASGASELVILKSLPDSNNTDKIYLNDENQNFDFTDKLVATGKEYTYSVKATVGKEGHWGNKGFTDYDDLVEYPRYEKKQITATGGSGAIKITNKPSLTFNTSDYSITFSTAPELSSQAKSYRLSFEYERENWGWTGLYEYDSNIKNLKPSLYNHIINEPAEWNFKGYWINASFDSFRYEHWEESTDDFSAFPAKLNVTEQAKPTVTATATDKGIKLQWENVPQNALEIAVRFKNKNKNTTLHYNMDDKSKTEVEETLVDKSTEYECYIEIYTNNRWVKSNTVTVKTKDNAGEGEPKLKNKPAATFDNKSTVTFSVLPEIEIPDRYKRCLIDFNYMNKEKGIGTSLYYHYMDDQNLKKTIGNEEFGTWALEDYCIRFRITDSGNEHFYSDSNLSKIPNVPQTIVLSEENRFSLTATPTDEGIKLEWRNLPEETTSLEIHDKDQRILFKINDLTKITSVVDKNVTKGKKYSYRLEARNVTDYGSSWLADSSSVEVTATGGTGEKQITLQATKEGIKLSCTKTSETTNFVISKKLSDSNFEADIISFFDQNQTFDFTDVFVAPGKEYSYVVQETIGKEADWTYGYTGYDDLIEYPRYEKKQITATGGSGDIKITNKPSVTCNSSNYEITFSKAPEFPIEVSNYRIRFGYERREGNIIREGSTLFEYGSYNKDLKTKVYDHITNKTGEWYFKYYRFDLDFDTFSYEHYSECSDDFEAFPETITIQ
ncbi:MAG: hypothetical protein J6X78_10190 [Treponema sp.]|nr:hypothetical protein [Treponema sp.]